MAYQRRLLATENPNLHQHLLGELYKALRIKRAMSTVYYSQTNSQMKRINQEVEVFLRHYINYRQDDWMKWLATTGFQYNDKEHAVTEHTLFYMNYGRHP